jgi:hypothetical protein
MPAIPKIVIKNEEVFADQIGQLWSPATIELSWPRFPGLRAPSVFISIVAPARAEMTVEQLRQAQIGAAHDVLTSALLSLERVERPAATLRPGKSTGTASPDPR